MAPGGGKIPRRRCEELPHLYHGHSRKMRRANSLLCVKIKEKGGNRWFPGIKKTFEKFGGANAGVRPAKYEG